MTEYKLNELYELSSGISSKPEQAGHGYPFCSFSTVFNNIILPEELPDLMDTSSKERQTYSIKAGDVFFTRTSETVGELAMSSVAVKDYPNATYSGFLKRLRSKVSNTAYPKYMAYYFRSKYFRKIVTNKAVMTLRASFNEDIFNDITVILPSYTEQVKIGNLFYEIERKIRNNNSICSDLEAMAKQLYDYWFVQFDFPDENGKPYKTSGGKMVWNEELNRKIPEGWKVGTFNSICSQVNGYPFSSDSYIDNGLYKLYTIKNVQDGYISTKVDNNINNIPSKMNNECLLTPGDIIMSLTGNVGRVGIVFENNALLNQRVIKLKSNNTNKMYLYLTLRDTRSQKAIEKIAVGTSQKNLSPIEFGNIKIIVPQDEILEQFKEKTNCIYSQITSLMQENQQLTSLRDFLLPMLMNGQVKVG